MGFIVTQRMIVGEGKQQKVYEPLYMTKAAPHTWSGARKDAFIFDTKDHAQECLDAENLTDPQFRYAIEDADGT